MTIKLSNYKKGVISIVLSALGFASMAFFVKLAGDLPVMQKAIFRNSIAVFAACIMLKNSNIKFKLAAKNRWPMVWRCLFGTIGIVCNFFVIDYLALGDASMLQNMAPFFAIVVSYFVLHEKMDRLTMISIFIALIGAAFIVKPGRGLLSLPALIGLFGGIFAGGAYTYVRRLGLGGVPASLVIFSYSLSSVIAMAPFVIVNHVAMSVWQFFCLLLAGLCGVVGQTFITLGYRYAPAKEISIFGYTQVIFAALLGYVLLGEIPDIYSIIGYVIIITVAFVKWNISRKKAQEKSLLSEN